jgi:serine protease
MMIAMSKARVFAALIALSLQAPIVSASVGPASPRVDLRALDTGKQFDQFIVKYRAGTAEANSRVALTQALDLAAVRSREQVQREQAERGGDISAQSWVLNPSRRLALGADVVKSTRKLDHAQTRILMQMLAANPDVEYVEIDQTLHALLTPNDPQYVNQWSLSDADAGIRANRAWDLGSGAGAVVAVIDTGITDHSDLNANVLPGYDFISDPAIANDGNGRDADAHDPGDGNGGSASTWHGTHVAGTIAAVTNNGVGVAGVAFNAKVMPVRVLGIGGGAGSDIADAIVWASGGAVPGAPANANPAEVLNLSLGGSGGCSATFQNAIDFAVAQGATIIVAAGNDSVDAANGNLSSCNNIIVAGANTNTSARSSFSNYGSHVDVSAPGSNIISTINVGTTSPTGEGYAYYSGTSMATPHVAAAAALAQAYRVARGLAPYTPAQLETQLKATAYPMTLGCPGISGAGIIDARTLLDVADGQFSLLGDGVAASNLAAATNAALNFAMVSTGKSAGLSFSSSGGSGNADLYVKFGAAPTTLDYDCRSNAGGNIESCTIPSALPGTYYVMLQAATGYSGVTLTGSASGNLKPLPNFSYGTSNLTANFTDASTDSDGSIASRTWNFGDGSTTTATNPTHNYSLGGAYTVQLTSTDSAGASSCTLKQVSVNPATVALSNGVAVNGLAGKVGAQLRYTLAVPSGATALNFSTSGGTGDADLYVKFGSEPTLSVYDCISGSPTTTESCDFSSPQAGTYYVMVDAYSAISGVTLKGSYNGSTSGGVSLSIADLSITEGNSGSKQATFRVRLSAAASGTVTYDIATSNGSATAGSDYVAKSLAGQTIAAGVLSRTFTVTINGDTAIEPNETFNVTVGNVTGASIADGQAVGTISNDDCYCLSIDNVTIAEGNSGSKQAIFTVKLSQAAPGTVTYNIATANSTATTADNDYVASSLSGQSIPSGTLSKTFSVTVNGDTKVESTERFKVNLSNVNGATVSDAQGLGTISNDD